MSSKPKVDIFAILSDEIESRDREQKTNPAEMLALPEKYRRVMVRLTRMGSATAEEIAQAMDLGMEEASESLAWLEQRGFVEGPETYRVRLAKKRGATLPGGLWDAIGERVDKADD